jgi:hypothetical protein
MIRQVDSSLLDEWEKMRDPNYQRAETKEIRPPGAEEAARDITRDAKTFTAAIRNRIFTFLRGVVNQDYEAALESLNETRSAEYGARNEDQNLPDPDEWTEERLRQVVEAFHVGHKRICLDPNARNVRHTYVLPSEDKKTWRVQQVLVDPEEHNDWIAELEVDLASSRAAEEPVVRLVRFGAIA